MSPARTNAEIFLLLFDLQFLLSKRTFVRIHIMLYSTSNAAFLSVQIRSWAVFVPHQTVRFTPPYRPPAKQHLNILLFTACDHSGLLSFHKYRRSGHGLDVLVLRPVAVERGSIQVNNPLIKLYSSLMAFTFQHEETDRYDGGLYHQQRLADVVRSRRSSNSHSTDGSYQYHDTRIDDMCTFRWFLLSQC